jgi:hypothetical protein
MEALVMFRSQRQQTTILDGKVHSRNGRITEYLENSKTANGTFVFEVVCSS